VLVEKVKCVIDKVKCTSKPTNGGAVTNRMPIDIANEYSIDEIKQSILDGKTVRPSYCGTTEDTWQSQQMFMIDIDNEAKLTKDIVLGNYIKKVEGKDKVRFLVGSEQHRSYDNIIEHCKNINLTPSFIYTSFNHKDEQHKYRLVFILDEVITDFKIAKKIQLYLMECIGNVDMQCKNINRYYYAGKNIVFDSENILNFNNIIELSKDINPGFIPAKPKKDKGLEKKKDRIGDERKRVLYNNGIEEQIPILSSTPKLTSLESANKDTINAITIRDTKYLKAKYGNNEKITFETKQEFINYIRVNINLGELLGFSCPKSIKCIFHNDRNNSASIFQLQDDGAWIYKCHSSSCGVTYNIIGVIERLAGFKSRPNTYKFIKEIFNLAIAETEWQKAQKEILQENIDMLYGDINFESNCPQTNKNISKIKHYLERFINIAMKNVYNEELTDEKGQVVFFASADYICKEMGISSNSINKIYQKIAVFAYHKLLNKLDNDNIPERLKKKAQAIIINYNQNNSTDNNKLRHVNFFSIPLYNVNNFPEIEQRGKQWKDNYYTMKGVSREMFYRAEGLEIANEIYPQYKKVTETIDGKKNIIDRTTTKSSDERTNNIVIAINELIEEHGYATEKEIVQKLRFKYRYKTTEVQIKKSLKEILDAYDLQRIRAKKEIKDKYGIDSEGYPSIIIKKAS